MKNIKVLILVLSLFVVGTQSIAALNSKVKAGEETKLESSDVVKTERKVIDDSSKDAEFDKTKVEEAKPLLTDDIIKELRACTPQDEKYDFDIMGVNFTFKVKINGWVNDKCDYHLSAKINSLSEEVRKSFGVTAKDEKISKIEPKIQCGFNKKQLNLLVDAIVEEDKKNVDQINRIMNDPSEIVNLPTNSELTKKEKQLMEMLTEESVCSFVNVDEVMSQIQELSPIPKEF